MRRAGAVLLTTACLGVLVAGCAAETSHLPGLTASPSVSPTSSPSPSPTGIVESSDPDLGIVFDEVPDLSGDEADVYNWIATYEKAYWRTLTTNQVSTDISLLASPAVQADLEQLAQSNAEDKWVVEGVLHVRIDAIAVQGDAATASTCRDFTDVTVTADGSLLTPEEAGSAEPMHRALTLLRMPGDRWVVQTNDSTGTC